MKKKVVRKVKKSVQTKFMELRDELADKLIGRDSEVRGLLVALLSRSHVLLLGPPGTAKSYLVQTLASMVEGSEYFDLLLTRFSLPEEVFGPLDVAGLKKGEYQRLVDGYLPTANFAFLDEIFKANSSILNSLLRIINERTYRQGTQTVQSSIETVVGASNELPESKELDALYDRFLLRYWTTYIDSRDGMKKLFHLQTCNLNYTVTLRDINNAQREVEKVDVDDDVLESIIDIKDATEKAGFVASDRRWKAILHIIKAAAYLEGRTNVEQNDLLILADCLWNDPQDRRELTRIISKTVNPVFYQANKILDAAKETFSTIPFDDNASNNTSVIFQKVLECNTQFKTSIKKLNNMKNGRQNSLVDSVIEKIEDMSDEAVKYIARLSNLDL